MRPQMLAAVAASLLVTHSAALWSPINACPSACAESNDVSTWIPYHSADRLALCNQTMLLDFNIYNPLNDSASHSTIYACTTNSTSGVASSSTSTSAATTTGISSTLELGVWGLTTSTEDDVLSAIQDVQTYLGGLVNDGKFSTIFGYSGKASVGLYIGGRLDPSNAAAAVADEISNYISSEGVYEQMAIQYCGSTSNYIVGLAINTNGDLPAVQDFVESWSHSECVTGFDSSLYVSSSLTVEVGLYKSSTLATRSTLHRRDTCTTAQVVSGDTCTTLVSECGITDTEFYEYNNATDLCSTLAVGQYICCSSGDLPDLTPNAYSNGTCYTYLVESGDSCSALAAAYEITLDDIENYNNNTWGWLGCDDLQAGYDICLSSGDPPFPSAVSGAECGPQVPGTTANGTDYDTWSSLNPCPLNACCDVWGECGVTPEFCTVTESTTGAPGTAANGTNGCIFNCGTAITNDSDAPDEFYSIGYFEAFNVDRSCLTMDASYINTDKYTHIIFAFGIIDSDFSITINQTDQFEQFLALDDVKKIVSFGGWDFSTDADTYMIFREGVTEENRKTLAQNIADFVSDNDLDGVDFDWEYPGEPDIEGIPAGSDDDGTNYLAFLKEVRTLIGDDKTISIAIPASYWYLKAFPIADLNDDVLDFFIFMSYDLHGQWDYGHSTADDGCADGNCLRSHVNLTETGYALSMVTKGGAQTNKLMVGVASYGRSFEMTTANCTGPDCFYTGPDSGATPGRCTATAGYISNAEINEIISENPTVQVLFDSASDSDIIVYNDTQWVGYMTNTTKSTRTTYYQGLNMGGTTEWAVDLERFIESVDDLTIVDLDVDLTDSDQCKSPSSDESSAEASSERNVAAYLDAFFTNLGDGPYEHWERLLFNDSNVNCASYPENVYNCDIPDSSTCSSYEEPAQYWAQFVVANYYAYMIEYGSLFTIADTNMTNQVSALVDAFPVQSGTNVPDTASLMTNFGGAFSLISSAAGGTEDGAVASSLSGVIGGIFSEAGSNVSDDEDSATTDILEKRCLSIITAYFNGVSEALKAMFEDGDISSWDIEGDYDHPIANFFDGRYMFELETSIDLKIESAMNTQLMATLAGTALSAANYYILKNAYTTSSCEDKTSGVVIDDYCYTLEYPGSSWSVASDSTSTDLISSSDLKTLENDYYVNITQLYLNSYECQNTTGTYGGSMVIDILQTSSTLPTCYYNLPVLTYTRARCHMVALKPGVHLYERLL
ncbi:glycoside hydrolase [Penicillium malachiteum]|uniref:chitinase n=1 Tax=Penicillium malachiteum TaxID=1324776 RepID=A0AAD6MSW2_9EURO|nr:glycoside hydrolase [Penicillium malachiteum]